MSSEDIAADIDPASNASSAGRQVTIHAALAEAISRKLEYIEWTPEEMRGRVTVTSDSFGVRTYWLDKIAILRASRQAVRWLVPSI